MLETLPLAELYEIPEGMYAWPVNRDITAYMTVPRDSRGPMANEGMLRCFDIRRYDYGSLH